MKASIFTLLTPDLLLPKYKNPQNPYAGYCYVLAEALKDFDFYDCWKPMFIRHEGVSHWYLQRSCLNYTRYYGHPLDLKTLIDEALEINIIDPTSIQFKTKIDYTLGKGKGFLTKGPSRRAKILIQRIKDFLPTINGSKVETLMAFKELDQFVR